MIAKILENYASFPGIGYNTNKIDRNTALLMKVSGFGALEAMQNLRPQDYLNYLMLVSSVNTRIKKQQFHAVISARQRTYTAEELTTVASLWLKEMGYEKQPYMIVFHKDTNNNHVHVVSTRVGKDGKKINSAYENLRSYANLNKVLGFEYALQYRFSTKAQFYMLVESKGYLGRDMPEQKLLRHIAEKPPDKARAIALKDIFFAHKDKPDFIKILQEEYQIQLLFHAAPGKDAYGYTIIDHATKQVFKGSEVLSMKYLNSSRLEANGQDAGVSGENDLSQVGSDHIGPVWIADDIDDEAILGRNRHRKKQARTNTR